MNSIEEIYDQAIELMRKGHSQQDVLVKFADYKNELEPLLDLSHSLLSIPKNIVPTPMVNRKYALAKTKSFWLNWVPMSRLAAASLSLILVFSAFAATGYAAAGSLPGQALFAVKKIGEQVQLAFAGSAQNRANLQIAIAQSRLSDAQEVFSNPQSPADEKNAALNELTSQTSSAVAVVGSVAQNNPQSQSNPPLLNSLENITKQQQSLLTQIKPDSQIQAATNNALKTLGQNSEQLSQIKESVAVADSDQTLTNLNSTSTAVAVLGQISQVSADQITVEKTTFQLDSQTTITDTNGDNLQIKDLSSGDQANVVGTQQKNAILAEQILVTSQIASSSASTTAGSTLVLTGSVPGTSLTGASSTATSTYPDVKKPDKTDAAQPVDKNGTSSTSPVLNFDPNSDSGSFILESPSPQFNP